MSEIPRHWRLKKQRYGLVGEVCPHCDYKIFPSRDICPNCGDEGGKIYIVQQLAKQVREFEEAKRANNT